MPQSGTLWRIVDQQNRQHNIGFSECSSNVIVVEICIFWSSEDLMKYSLWPRPRPAYNPAQEINNSINEKFRMIKCSTPFRIIQNIRNTLASDSTLRARLNELRCLKSSSSAPRHPLPMSETFPFISWQSLLHSAFLLFGTLSLLIVDMMQEAVWGWSGRTRLLW